MPYTDLRTGRHSDIGRAYHVTTATRSREPRFCDLHAARRVIIEMQALHTEGLVRTLAFVLMPDHLHWLMTVERKSLSEAVRLLKSRSARAIGGNLWQPNFYDHAVRDDEDLRAMARYIVANPLRAGLVERIGDYPWWDSVWLDGALSG